MTNPFKPGSKEHEWYDDLAKAEKRLQECADRKDGLVLYPDDASILIELISHLRAKVAPSTLAPTGIYYVVWAIAGVSTPGWSIFEYDGLPDKTFLQEARSNIARNYANMADGPDSVIILSFRELNR